METIAGVAPRVPLRFFYAPESSPPVAGGNLLLRVPQGRGLILISPALFLNNKKIAQANRLRWLTCAT
jgi:hypothetical protein